MWMLLVSNKPLEKLKSFSKKPLLKNLILAQAQAVKVLKPSWGVVPVPVPVEQRKKKAANLNSKSPVNWPFGASLTMVV
ncbi:MAG: hypothetical protein GY780_03970 [bacterium]|nr:hypothetical protein [bacterium]